MGNRDRALPGSKVVTLAAYSLLSLMQFFLLRTAEADILCVPNSSFFNRRISIISDGEVCPRNTKPAVSIPSKLDVEKLIADALESRVEEPHRFFLSAQAEAPTVCQGIDVKSRCSDRDGCMLRYRMGARIGDPQRKSWDEVQIKYDSTTRVITLSWDGVFFGGKLGSGEHRRIFSLDGQHAFVATDKPTDGCVDLTNFVDDGRDTMWLYTTSSFPLDGALLD